MMRRVERFDPSAVMRAEDEGAAAACGRAAVAAVMGAARGLGANRATVLAYANSGDVTKDRSSVVGYGAAAFWRTTPA
jgi:AmmeMemoRadiSam system protein B